MRSFFVFFVLATFLATKGYSQSHPVIEGPQVHGLALRLTSDRDKETGEMKSVRIILRNATDEAITLKSSAWAHRADSYETYLRQSVAFSSFPKVLPGRFSVSGRDLFGQKQFEKELMPGKSTSVEIKLTKANWLEGGLRRRERISFVRPGTYLVRANLKILDGKGEEITLFSNEIPFVVGNSKELPFPSFGKIFDVKEREMKIIAKIDLGRKQGIKEGVVFHTYLDSGLKKTIWKLSVISVSNNRCQCEATVAYRGFAREPEKTPTIGQLVKIIKLKE